MNDSVSTSPRLCRSSPASDTPHAGGQLPCLRCGLDLRATIRQSWEWVTCPGCQKGFDTRQVRANIDRGYIRPWEIAELLLFAPMLLGFLAVMCRFYALAFGWGVWGVLFLLSGVVALAGNLSRRRAARVAAWWTQSPNRAGERRGGLYWSILTLLIAAEAMIAWGYIAVAVELGHLTF